MSILYKDIEIEGIKNVNRILEFSMTINYGEHSRAILKVELNENMTLTQISMPLSQQKVKIKEKSSNSEKILFWGWIENYEFIHNKNYYEANIYLVSGTYLLDQTPKSRSFQNSTITYEDIIKTICKNTEKAGVNFLREKKKVEIPIIQYEETDWEFICRLASHYHTLLLPDIKSGEAKFWFGIIDNGKKIEFLDSEYKVVIDKRYYVRGTKKEQFIDRYFFYYEINLNENYDIGDYATIKGQEMYIYSKAVKLIGGQIVFQYRFSNKNYISVKKSFNKRIKGCSLPGTVIQTDKEYVKIHLDIDEKQNVEEAYFYSWIPETGNLFYCMPQIGTKIALYIAEENEETAKAVRCIRTNGGSYEELQNYEKRYFTSEHRKRMQLFPNILGFYGTSSSSPFLIQTTDESGIQIKSNTAIVLSAGQAIQVQGENIHIYAPKQITTAKSNLSTTTVLNICNQFDAIGKVGGLQGNDKKKYIKPPKSKKKNQNDNSSIAEKTAVAAIPTGSEQKGVKTAAIGALANKL